MEERGNSEYLLDEKAAKNSGVEVTGGYGKGSTADGLGQQAAGRERGSESQAMKYARLIEKL